MKDRTLLMIPGPIEFDPAVLATLGEPTTSHLAPEFIEAFGYALEQLQHVFLCQDGQPFVLAGSGTLAMDAAGANLVEPGDKALVVNTGFFSDRFATILERYGAQVKQVRAPVGDHPDPAEIERAFKADSYKLVTITHVDTSTGVLADVKTIARLAKQYGALVIVDGVCSVAGEELRMDDWGVDLALTASQKAIGVPPGLALWVAGPGALEAFKRRKSPVLNFYADWNNWLAVLEAYQARKTGYFGTPPVNLIFALKVSLSQILAEGLEARFARHKTLSRACKAGLAAMGLSQVPVNPEYTAHTLSCPRYPANINGAEFLGNAAKAGVTLAGGLYPAIRSEYFRIGHMGVVKLKDILVTLEAIEAGLRMCGHQIIPGNAIAAAHDAYLESSR